eukprot:4563826-Prymnesium_polylepis.1
MCRRMASGRWGSSRPMKVASMKQRTPARASSFSRQSEQSSSNRSRRVASRHEPPSLRAATTAASQRFWMIDCTSDLKKMPEYGWGVRLGNVLSASHSLSRSDARREMRSGSSAKRHAPYASERSGARMGAVSGTVPVSASVRMGCSSG